MWYPVSVCDAVCLAVCMCMCACERGAVCVCDVADVDISKRAHVCAPLHVPVCAVVCAIVCAHLTASAVYELSEGGEESAA